MDHPNLWRSVCIYIFLWPQIEEQMQAMLKYEPETGEVQLVVDRGYEEGEPIKVWFGPQPNQRAFLNYGIVDEDNPHDKMTLEVSRFPPLSCPLLPLQLSQKMNLVHLGKCQKQ